MSFSSLSDFGAVILEPSNYTLCFYQTRLHEARNLVYFHFSLNCPALQQNISTSTAWFSKKNHVFLRSPLCWHTGKIWRLSLWLTCRFGDGWSNKKASEELQVMFPFMFPCTDRKICLCSLLRKDRGKFYPKVQDTCWTCKSPSLPFLCIDNVAQIWTYLLKKGNKLREFIRQWNLLGSLKENRKTLN